MGENHETTDHVVSIAEAAEVTGYSARSIQSFVVAGLIPRAARGQYRLTEVVKGVALHIAMKAKRPSGGEGRARVADARATEIEGRIVREMRGLILRSEADQALQVLVDAFNHEAPMLQARIVAHGADGATVSDIIASARARAAETAARLKSELQTGGGA
jgi:hypothetical protein